MTIYDQPVRTLFHEMVVDLELQPGQTFTRQDAVDWFAQHYPKIKEGTVNGNLSRLSTNVAGRVNWRPVLGEDDLLYKVDTNSYRLYEPDSDPSPISSANPPSGSDSSLPDTEKEINTDTKKVKELVEIALQQMVEPWTEDIIDQVFSYIENEDNLLAEYQNVSEQLGHPTITNNWVGRYTKMILGAETISNGHPAQNNLSQTYSKLKFAIERHDVIDVNLPEDRASVVFSYTEIDFLAETYLTTQKMEVLKALLTDKQQAIFYGPPGTGKTYVARALSKLITGRLNPDEQLEIVQFHPSYSYEDFIEGIRPESKEKQDGSYFVDYPAKAGVFRRFCEKAAQQPEQKFVFIVDEINRGNIPQIFGELMLLLEYRHLEVRLPYSGKQFFIPENVYLIGTMNTADRSIALVDFALRRRFHFINFKADPDLFSRWLAAQDNIKIPYLDTLYRRLSTEAIDDPNYAIGPSYFMDASLSEMKLEYLWQYSIEPYLLEYYLERPEKATYWAWDGELVRGIRQA
ncbi:MAG TPA: AAA family ATPase [Anaerolineae bacterium]|nr:AAA family ATPase [Anaerolineae bacterium]